MDGWKASILAYNTPRLALVTRLQMLVAVLGDMVCPVAPRTVARDTVVDDGAHTAGLLDTVEYLDNGL